MNAAVTIAGIELMHRIRKGQFGLPRRNVQGEAAPGIWNGNALLKARKQRRTADVLVHPPQVCTTTIPTLNATDFAENCGFSEHLHRASAARSRKVKL